MEKPFVLLSTVITYVHYLDHRFIYQSKINRKEGGWYFYKIQKHRPLKIEKKNFFFSYFISEIFQICFSRKYSMFRRSMPFKKRLSYRCFTVNFVKLLKPVLHSTFAWYNLYDSQSVFNFSLRLHFHTGCSYRYVKPHLLSVWPTRFMSCTRSSGFFSKNSSFMLEWMISKNVLPFKNLTLLFTMALVELQFVLKFSETEKKIHFLI